jgi:hypothetical protein
MSPSSSSSDKAGRGTAAKEGVCPSSSRSHAAAAEIAARTLLSFSRCPGSSGIGRKASHLWPGRVVEEEEESEVEVGVNLVENRRSMPSQRRAALDRPSPRLTIAFPAAAACGGDCSLVASTEMTAAKSAERRRTTQQQQQQQLQTREVVDGRRTRRGILSVAVVESKAKPLSKRRALLLSLFLDTGENSSGTTAQRERKRTERRRKARGRERAKEMLEGKMQKLPSLFRGFDVDAFFSLALLFDPHLLLPPSLSPHSRSTNDLSCFTSLSSSLLF